MEHRSDQGVHANLLHDDGPLVEALRRGDEAAFVVVVERYHPALVRLARAYVHDLAVAEEVAQEAWLGFLEGLHRFAGRASLKTYLFRILANCASASRRREARSVPVSRLPAFEEDEGTPAVNPDRFLSAGQQWGGHWAIPPEQWPEEALLAAETWRLVEGSMEHLPSLQRAVLVLRDVEGWSAAEACGLLGISAANQRVLLHRARSRVRREIEVYVQHTGEDDDRAHL